MPQRKPQILRMGGRYVLTGLDQKPVDPVKEAVKEAKREEREAKKEEKKELKAIEETREDIANMLEEMTLKSASKRKGRFSTRRS
jgi:uncharacterized membrane protein (DUF106 family)